MRTNKNTYTHRRQRGFSLIELLVAALIGVIVIGGVGGVFLSVIQTNRAKMALDNSTETLRYAHYVLANQIRNAEEINVNGDDLVLTLQAGVQDCLGGTHNVSRFSFTNGSLRCSTTNPASPQEIVAGLQSVAFDYGCILTGVPPAPAAVEIRESDLVTARSSCDVEDLYDDGQKATTVFVTLTVNPFPGEAGNARSVSFSATARGIMAPRITRVLRIERDPDLILELFATTAAGEIIGKANTGCEHFGAISVGPDQVFYKILATNTEGVPQTNVTGGIALSYTDVTTTPGQYVPRDFAPINQVFSIPLIDDHIKQGSRAFTVRLDDDEAFGTFEHVTIVTTPVTTTICEGSGEPDGGMGPDDTVTLKLFASDENGNLLDPADTQSGLEGQRLWFIVKAFAPNGAELPEASGTIQVAVTAGPSDAAVPVNPVPIGRAFAVDLLQDADSEGPETFELTIQGGAISGAIVNEQFERAIPSELAGEHTVRVTILDVVSETARFAAAGTQSSGTTEIDVAWPAHAIGDFAVLIVETASGQTIPTPPTGWVPTIEPQADAVNSSGSTLHVYHQFAVTNNMPTANILLPGGDHIVGRIFTFKGIDVATPILGTPVVTTKTAPSTTVTNPSADVTLANAPVLLVATRPNDTADLEQFGEPINSNLASLTEAGEAGTSTGNGGGFRLAVGTKLTPGPTGPTTGSGPNTTNVTATIVLKPR